MARRKRRITAEDLFRIRVPLDADVSPGGDRVVFSVQRGSIEKNRYGAELRLVPFGGGRARTLTRGDANDGSPRWSPDGRNIAFVSDREKETSDIWWMPSDGGEARKLTDLGGGPVRGLEWAPDGKSLLFLHRSVPKEDPEKKKLRATYKHITRLYHKLDGMGWYGGARWQLWIARFPSGAASPVTSGPCDVLEAAWSPKGDRIALLSNRRENPDLHPEGADVFTVTPRGRALRQVTAKAGMRGGLAWSADGRSIFFRGNHAGPGEWHREPMAIRKVPAGGGAEIVLTPRVDNWTMNAVITDTLQGFQGPIARFDANDGSRIAFFVDEEGACRVYSVSEEGGDVRLEFGGAVNVVGFRVDAATGRAAVVAGEMMTAGDVFAADWGAGAAPRRVSRLNDTLFRGLDLTEPEEVWFRNGRTRIQGWILKPPGFRKDRRYPALIEVHGGPMGQYGYTFFHEMHLLAAKGYVVAFSNPRGSSGRGYAFMRSIVGDWGNRDFADVMAVTDSVARRRYVDGRRVGILGGSYGGFMTTWAIGHSRRFRAAVTQRALGNWTTEFGSSDFGYDIRHEIGGTPWDDPEKYFRLSPNSYVKRMRTPLLIIHSEEDYRCPVAQAEELFTALKLLGRTVELVRFEGESHGLSRGGKPMNRLERLRRIADWFERHL